MNKIVTNSGGLTDEQYFAKWGVMPLRHYKSVDVAPGFEKQAIVTVNQPPPQHDWSQANSRLSELREEFAGLEPVTFRATLAIEGEVSWNLNIPKMPRNDARELRRLVQNYLADLSLNLERKITVQGNASTLPVGEP